MSDTKDCEAFFCCLNGLNNKRRWKKSGIILGIVLIIILVFALLLFVIFPIVFMNSLALQRLFMFTNLNLPSSKTYFESYQGLQGYRNLYVAVQDNTTKEPIELGVWHILPKDLINHSITNDNFDYDDALENSNFNVLLYFHGIGEARSYQTSKYEILRLFFHVVTFDYRNFADSTSSIISEDSVIDDSIQLYMWVFNKTSCPIFIYGHSLGSALATRTAKALRSRNVDLAGLILDAPFTKMRDELYFHPVARIFSWLPWFKITILDPLERNGFVFDTETNILGVDRPVLFFCAEDDNIVHYKMTRKLWEISKSRKNGRVTIYYQFPAELEYHHIFIYSDPFYRYFIK